MGVLSSSGMGMPIGLKKIPNLGSVDVGREWYWVSQLCRDLTGMMGWGGWGSPILRYLRSKSELLRYLRGIYGT